ncbi:putative ABC transporter [Zymoseptoria tritici IPO323]|uniref:ABC transporter n=1 Tax=Zymoseptoria tritici (strain CBS 115943 / IPO323) TaxID=336722 RepID=F9X1Z3_ZYMTI|nr:putative ABC transporter [Zymoseptoria tritici IPO323]EGP90788.1 putative ABC transporter [Zymoseptoria tritici IPO323]
MTATVSQTLPVEPGALLCLALALALGAFSTSERLRSWTYNGWYELIHVGAFGGRSKKSSIRDLPQLDRDLGPESTRNALSRAWAARDKLETGSTLRVVLTKCLRKQFLAPITPRLFLIAFRYCQPLLIQYSIRYAANYVNSSGRTEATWLVFFAVVIYSSLALSKAMYSHRQNKLKLIINSALVGLIHEKVLHSASTSFDGGDVTTLISNDVESLTSVGEMFHETWAQVVEVLIGFGLLARQVGWIWPLSLVLIYLCSHVSRYVASHLKPYQRAWNEATQRRLGATASMLSSMKIVKMLGFQSSLVKRIAELRSAELEAASKLRWVMVLYNASANALGIFSPAITLVLYAIMTKLRGESLDTAAAFSTTAILSMVTHPANMVMTIIPRAVATLAGFDRIQEFLLRPVLEEHREEVVGHCYSDAAIRLDEVAIGRSPTILNNLNIEVKAGALTVLSGPTSCGKTSLLRTILGETEPSEGRIEMSVSSVGFCAQQPWLPNGMIREAIHGSSEDVPSESDKWYDCVIAACCLTHDFEALPEGDETAIGSRGMNLSGGQRQRVALARALFARPTMLLLDDCFSGLDGETEKAVFQNLFGPGGLVREIKATVFLVSNSYQYFDLADHVVVLGNGTIVDQGLCSSIGKDAAAVAKFSAAPDRTRSPGSEEKAPAITSAKFNFATGAPSGLQQDFSQHTGDAALYAYYFRALNLADLFFFILSTALYAFFITVPQYWLQQWTGSDGTQTFFYVAGYIMISTLSWSSTSVQMWSVLIRVAPRSGLRLHRRLLRIVSSAPLWYFSETDSGSIMNRFSQDVQIIDKQVPAALQTVITELFKLVMQTVLLSTTGTWLTFSLLACMPVVYYIQRAYLQTSRQLRALELEAKAAVTSNFSETVEGIETIRAFDWTNAARRANIKAIDTAQRPELALLDLQRWLNLILDLLSGSIAIGVVSMAVSLRETVSGAQIGIALNSMLVVSSTLLKLVESWTTLETSMGAVGRLMELEETVPAEEGEGQDVQVMKAWSVEGRIEFRHVTVAYSSDMVALRKVNLTIEARQKVIVCGRTGSGKSTTLLALLRLLPLQSGKLLIDGVDITTVSLDHLRQRAFITVSQDPLIFVDEATRFNLDPDDLSSDSTIIEALSKTGLLSHFRSADDAPTSSFLHKPLSAFPTLSTGQRQLFALTRALIKAKTLRTQTGSRPIVLLDEITASLDTATEQTIYRLIEEEFSGKRHTVVMITHRVVGLEKWMVEGRGCVVVLGDGTVERIRKAVGMGQEM